jgi:hypothetical protein
VRGKGKELQEFRSSGVQNGRIPSQGRSFIEFREDLHFLQSSFELVLELDLLKMLCKERFGIQENRVSNRLNPAC